MLQHDRSARLSCCPNAFMSQYKERKKKKTYIKGEKKMKEAITWTEYLHYFNNAHKECRKHFTLIFGSVETCTHTNIYIYIYIYTYMHWEYNA
jgi:hypothetical protein